jgi:diadenosine tetraphosphate (Ap4A) HIT family hydrolase
MLNIRINFKLVAQKSFIFKNKINFRIKSPIQKAFSNSTYIPTIFDKIIKREIKSDIIFEDDHTLAFKDINPVAPIHILIIPKVRNNLTGISTAEPENIECLGRLLLAAKQIGKKLNMSDGYRVVINEGENGGQTIKHLHLHLIGGCQLGWPPMSTNKKNTL